MCDEVVVMNEVCGERVINEGRASDVWMTRKSQAVGFIVGIHSM